MKKYKREKLFYDLGKKPHLDSIKSVILFLDGYLAWFFDDPKPYSQAIRQGALGKEFAAEWRRIEKTLYKIAYNVRLIPEVRKHIALQGLFRAFSLILTVLALGLVFAGPRLKIPYSSIISIILVFVGAFFLILSWNEGRKFAVAIDRYYAAHPEKFKLKREYLKSVVQKLIYSTKTICRGFMNSQNILKTL